jgi:hypothetical protein
MSELLKSKGVKALLSGYLISNIGSWFRMLAVMGLLYDITGTTASLGFSIIIRYLPKFLVNIFFIHHISAINKQTLLLSGSLLSCLSVLTLAVTSPLHSVAIIYPLLVLISIGDSLIDPARMSSVRQLSNKQNMGKNTASFTIARELTMLFSASTGGILIRYHIYLDARWHILFHGHSFIRLPAPRLLIWQDKPERSESIAAGIQDVYKKDKSQPVTESLLCASAWIWHCHGWLQRPGVS